MMETGLKIRNMDKALQFILYKECLIMENGFKIKCKAEVNLYSKMKDMNTLDNS